LDFLVLDAVRLGAFEKQGGRALTSEFLSFRYGTSSKPEPLFRADCLQSVNLLSSPADWERIVLGYQELPL
jgi:hypothetical protein